MFSDTSSFAALGGLTFLFVLLIVWTIIWKALALWKSARAGSKAWFVVLLFVNTAGILEMLYLFVFSKHSKTTVPEIKA